jgi:hypothetical protein
MVQIDKEDKLDNPDQEEIEFHLDNLEPLEYHLTLDREDSLDRGNQDHSEQDMDLDRELLSECQFHLECQFLKETLHLTDNQEHIVHHKDTHR